MLDFAAEFLVATQAYCTDPAFSDVVMCCRHGGSGYHLVVRLTRHG